MATAKKPTPKKVIDVNNPGTTPPDSTSRPVIVTRKPMIEDPMVARSGPGAPPAPPLASRGKTIKPLTVKIEDKTEKSAEKPAAKKEAESSEKTEAPTIIITPDTSENTSEKDETPEAPTLPDLSSEKEEPKVPEVEAPEASESPKETTPPAAASSSQDAKDVKTDEEEQAPTRAAKERRAAEAAAAEKARMEKYQKMIEDKTYFAPIDQSVSFSTGGKIFLTLFIIIILAIAAGVLAIDAGLIEVGFTLPFNLIQN